MTSRSSDKIHTIEELAVIAEAARARGCRVVLAHGTFDLMHFGHIRHLQAARDEGDLLMVTITADACVNKGPGRPVFTHGVRAETLASLLCVDHVAINHAPTSENVLRLIRPDVYVKGSDYANPEDDVTGNINHEQAVVASYGGRTMFTNEVTYSSSSLINRHLDLYDPPLRTFLDHLRARNARETLGALIERTRDFKVLMVGDAIIDEYVYVEPMGRSPKENMIATLYRSRELFAGGVVAAANHIAGFCGEVEILTAFGEADSREILVRNSLKPNVRLWSLDRPDIPTTRKTRFIDQAYLRKLFELYHMNDTPLSGEDETRLIEAVRARAPKADVVIVTDFGHGLITPRVIETLIGPVTT